MPVGVIWTGRTNVTDGEPVQYDPITRTVIWQNDFVEATPGNRCPCTGIGFEVGIMPTSNDVGKVLNLVDNLKITATDYYTNEVIEKTATIITTDLTNDSQAQGKGEVKN